MEFKVMKQTEPVGTAYRYTDILQGDVDYTYVKVYLGKYFIIKKTAKGIWINYLGTKKFILLSARKKFACLTSEEAIESYIARKERQIRILSNQLNNAKSALSQAEAIEKGQR